MRSKAVWIAGVSVGCAMVSSFSLADDIAIQTGSEMLRTTRYTYNDHGEVTNTVDPGGRVTRYQYDSRAQDQGTTTYQYDNTFTGTPTYDAMGHVTTFTYDEKGEVDGDVVPEDMNANDAQTVDGRTLTYTYFDADGEVTASPDPLRRTTRFQYDDRNGAIGAETTNPDGNVMRYQYDTGSRNLGVVESLSGSSTTDDVHSSGSIDFNGRTTRYQYDARGVVDSATGGSYDVQLEDTTTNGILFRYQYDYTGGTTSSYGNGATAPGTTTGNLTGDLDPGHTYRYTYDYNINGATGTANFDLLLNPVPLPKSVWGGALLMSGLALHRLRRPQPANRIS